MSPFVPPAKVSDFSPKALALARQDLECVLARESELGDFGIGVFDERQKTEAERLEGLRAERQRILDPRSLAAFLGSRCWLRQFNKTKTLTTRGTSYGLKHIAEEDIGYVTNGVFFAAAVAEGFRIKRLSPD